MKKVFALLMVILFLLAGCATKEKKPQTTTSSDSSRTALSIEKAMQLFPYVFEGTVLASDPYPENSAHVLLDVHIDNVFSGDLEEGSTIKLRASYPDLFPVGEQRLIFAEWGETIGAGPYYTSNTALYSVGDTVNSGMIYGAEGKSYEEVIQKIREIVS